MSDAVSGSTATILVKQIGNKECALFLFKKHSCIPAVRQVWSRAKTVPVIPCRESLARHEAMRSANRIVGKIHIRADETRNGLRTRRQLQPLVQRPALIRLKWLKLIQRKRSGGRIFPTASTISGKEPL